MVPTLTQSYIAANPTEVESMLTVGELLREAAAENPDRIVFKSTPDGSGKQTIWTYAELLELAEKSASALLTKFKPGEHVAIWANNVPNWWLFEFGAAIAGITIVTINPASTERELSYILQNSDAVGLVMIESWRKSDCIAIFERVRDSLPLIREVIMLEKWDEFISQDAATGAFPVVKREDPFMIQYTSGTTGKPKGARISHRGAVNTAKFCNERFGLAQGSIWLNVMPLFHTGGSVYSTFGVLWNRGTIIMPPQFEAGLALATIERERANWITTVPTISIAMLDHPDFDKYDYSSLQVQVCGGAPVAPELVERIERDFGCEYIMICGQTEMSGNIFQTFRGDTMYHRTNTVGFPLGPAEVKIASLDDGSIVPIGEVGEICLRGFGVMIDYYNMPEATAAALKSDGWFHMGDLGTMEPDGYVTITGRLKDMVIRGGENIYPREIEDALLAHPAVSDAAVFGVPDPKWGEQIAAAVRLRPDMMVQENELKDFLRHRIMSFKIPAYWWFVESFPTTLSGKIQKFALREAFLARQQREAS